MGKITMPSTNIPVLILMTLVSRYDYEQLIIFGKKLNDVMSIYGQVLETVR